MAAEETVLGILLAFIITLIWACGEMARLANEDTMEELGLKKTASKNYMGAPMRKKYTGFDLEKEKAEKKERKRKKHEKQKGQGAVPGLDMGSVPGLNSILGGGMIELTPRDAQGTPRLLSARELQESAPSYRAPLPSLSSRRAMSLSRWI